MILPHPDFAPQPIDALHALVLRAQAEEPAAQTELVRLYTRRIAGFVRSIVRQPDAVEDITQTVFIKMFRQLPRLRDPGVFQSWLFTLAHNASVDFLRRRRCRPVTVGAEELAELPDETDHSTATTEIYEALDFALRRVPVRDRALIRLVVHGYSYQEIAAREKLSLGNVKIRLHRLRPFLRRCVGELTQTRLPEDSRHTTAKAA